MSEFIYLANIKKNNNDYNILNKIKDAINSNFVNFNREEFLKDFIGYIINQLNLPEIDVYYDKNLIESKKYNDAIAYFNNNKGIFFRPDIFTNNNEFFVNLIAISHELKHAETENLNKLNLKKVDEDVKKYVYCFDDEVLHYFGLYGEECYLLYYSHENEKISNDFAHNLVLNIISNLKNEINKNENPLLFSQLLIDEEKVKNVINCYNLLTEKIEETSLKKFNKNLIKEQEILLNNIKNQFNTIMFGKKRYVAEIINSVTYDVQILFRSFNFVYNEKVVKDLYEYALNNYYSNPIVMVIYERILSEPSFKVTKNDISNLIKMYEKFSIAVDFNNIEINKASLIKTYCEIKYDENFTNYILSNKEHLENIRNSNDIKLKYKNYENEKLK